MEGVLAIIETNIYSEIPYGVQNGPVLQTWISVEWKLCATILAELVLLIRLVIAKLYIKDKIFLKNSVLRIGDLNLPFTKLLYTSKVWIKFGNKKEIPSYEMFCYVLY